MMSQALGGGDRSKYKNHHYNKNTQIAAYLNPVEGHRGAMEKKGIQPRDHLRENRQAVKDLQSALREKKAQDSVPPPAMWKMERFAKVPSRIAQVIHQKPNSASPEVPEVDEPMASTSRTGSATPNKPFLRKGTLNRRVSDKALEAHRHRASSPLHCEDPLPVSARGCRSAPSPISPVVADSPRNSVGYAEGLTPRKPAVPRATDLARLAPKSNKNHIVENRKAAVTAHPPTKEDEEGPYRHKSFGQIPGYLQERKAEWAEEEERRRAALPDPNCPPGMRMLTDEERQETLQALAESEAEIRRQLVKMPLQVDTPSMLRRRETLERRLGEIAKDKYLFTKPKVFIKKDS